MTAARLLLTDAERYPFSADELAQLPPEHELISIEGHHPDDMKAAARGVGAIFAYHAVIDESVIAALRDCRVIVRCGTGYEKIDVSAARAAGIEVVYVPDYGAVDVATHAVALILACVRKLVSCDRAVRAGGWPIYPELRPMHRIENQVLGILGYGRIGRAAAHKAAALGMTVLAHDPLAGDSEEGVRLVDLETLLRSSDVLSVHAPLTPGTRGLIDAAAIAQMPSGSVLVNTSRAEIVDETALLDALDRGHLAAAGLDVFAEEPLPSNSRLLSQENVVLTPHSAVYNEESLGELRTRALDEATRALAGLAPRNPVPEG